MAGAARSVALTLLVVLLGAMGAAQQWPTHCGDPQHTAQSRVRPQCMMDIRWAVSMDTSSDINEAHYGSPLITAAGTVIVAQRTGVAGGFRILGLDNGARGAIIWEEASDYVYPSHGWTPMYQPVLAGAPGPSQRVYWPVAGGALRYRDNLDAPTANTSGFVFPWGTAAEYAAMRGDLLNSVMVNTPLTSRGADGSVYYAVRLQGPTPASVSATGLITSTMVRVDADGSTLLATAAAVGGDPIFARFPMQAAPAFSNDLATMYVVVAALSYNGRVAIVGLDPATLRVRIAAEDGRAYRIDALDPRSTTASGHIFEDSSSSLMVGPDGDVYYGLLGNPNRYTGWLLHWDATLSTAKLPGPFGWDNTPSVVPRELVPSYTGDASYLLAAKYNSYVGLEGGNGMHRLVLLDPGASETDRQTGLPVMRVVLSQLAPTLDLSVQSAYPGARKEWCTNTAVVDTVEHSIVANNEDGKSYRWDLHTNNVTQVLRMSSGRRQAYTPTAIAPTGEVLAINWAVLNVMGRSYSDVNGDNVVDLLDVALVLDHMGPCANVRDCPADVNGSGTVDAYDIGVIAAKWNLRCGVAV